nr:ammonium transporter [uncultured Moraxella sp.]
MDLRDGFLSPKIGTHLTSVIKKFVTFTTLAGFSSLAFAEETLAIETPTLNAGDTAWVLVATTLVLMMTLPGLALFYSGMVRKKNILGTMAHSFGAAAMASVVWMLVGYSLAFSEGSCNQFVGGFSHVFLSGIGIDDLTGTVPTLLFVAFQMTFAIITVAILAGSLAERIKFGSFMAFTTIWLVLVYAPVCHWVWGGGWLMNDGALDFAGGTVVHINAGVGGLVLAAVLGKRQGYGRESMAPSNLALTVIGTGLVWVGWFGFNGGSALAANGLAGNAILVSQVAAASGVLAWLAVEKLVRGKASMLGGASGGIAGLVGITPAAGFVTVGGALAIGILTAIGCFYSVNFLKRLLKIDDSLDAFGLHGVGGVIGAVLTGIFVSPAITGSPLSMPMLNQVWVQLEGILATALYCGVVTWIIAKGLQATIGLRVSDEEEYQGLDLSVHGERLE